VPSDLLLSMSTRYSSKDVLFYNIGNKDNKLRNQDCRKNIIHIAPSYAMLADAIAQFLVYKNWKKWLLITGQKANDKKY
jgi:ABC transporter substrate binding protein (PQQ-dependent alcohol dehydrogenase system)